MRITRPSLSLVLTAFILTKAISSQASTLSDLSESNIVSPPATVIGFVGGFVSHDNTFYSAVQMAARLSQDYAPPAYVRVFENRRGDIAYNEVVRLLDTDHNGVLTAPEKQNAHIVIYGQSWGGSQAITLARALGDQGIPVLLTVQVDSVRKIGQNDGVIPPNVARAVNYYQPHGYIHGRSQIIAADPARTQIIGNYKFDYHEHPYTCSRYSWFDRVFAKTHLEIECDPTVWGQIEALIRSNLPPRISIGADAAGRLP